MPVEGNRNRPTENKSALLGMLDADEAYFKQHGEPLFSSHMLDLSLGCAQAF